MSSTNPRLLNVMLGQIGEDAFVVLVKDAAGAWQPDGPQVAQAGVSGVLQQHGIDARRVPVMIDAARAHFYRHHTSGAHDSQKTSNTTRPPSA